MVIAFPDTEARRRMSRRERLAWGGGGGSGTGGSGGAPVVPLLATSLSGELAAESPALLV